MFPEFFDFELRDDFAGGVADDLGGEVDFEGTAGAGFGGEEVEGCGGGDGDGEHAVFEGVVEEDVGEGGGDNGFDAEVEEGPGGVFAA